VEIATSIDQCNGAISHKCLQDTQIHLGRSKTGPKAGGVVRVFDSAPSPADEFLGRLHRTQAILEELAKISSDIRSCVVTEYAGSPTAHLAKGSVRSFVARRARLTFVAFRKAGKTSQEALEIVIACSNPFCPR